ncbi:unnamed protein product [Vicia faba]|uniref:Uncharacterized protein n=1 Tax=Vicia faba TaxID=3906 RepID=A0AAV0ZKC6_VICFA|nr:unnamed protein product [Vicia faba]
MLAEKLVRNKVDGLDEDPPNTEQPTMVQRGNQIKMVNPWKEICTEDTDLNCISHCDKNDLDAGGIMMDGLGFLFKGTITAPKGTFLLAILLVKEIYISQTAEFRKKKDT